METFLAIVIDENEDGIVEENELWLVKIIWA
jgi:hypothetical protein